MHGRNRPMSIHMRSIHNQASSARAEEQPAVSENVEPPIPVPDDGPHSRRAANLMARLARLKCESQLVRSQRAVNRGTADLCALAQSVADVHTVEEPEAAPVKAT
jgi:hypothetical protein